MLRAKFRTLDKAGWMRSKAEQKYRFRAKPLQYKDIAFNVIGLPGRKTIVIPFIRLDLSVVKSYWLKYQIERHFPTLKQLKWDLWHGDENVTAAPTFDRAEHPLDQLTVRVNKFWTVFRNATEVARMIDEGARAYFMRSVNYRRTAWGCPHCHAVNVNLTNRAPSACHLCRQVPGQAGGTWKCFDCNAQVPNSSQYCPCGMYRLDISHTDVTAAAKAVDLLQEEIDQEIKIRVNQRAEGDAIAARIANLAAGTGDAADMSDAERNAALDEANADARMVESQLAASGRGLDKLHVELRRARARHAMAEVAAQEEAGAAGAAWRLTR